MKRVPLNSPEGRRLVNRGPAWREHPDYYAPDEPEEVPHTEYDPTPWHTQKDAREAAARMKAWGQTVEGTSLIFGLLTDEDWLNLARVALELRPQ
jgi:hypothetical protein